MLVFPATVAWSVPVTYFCGFERGKGFSFGTVQPATLLEGINVNLRTPVLKNKLIALFYTACTITTIKKPERSWMEVEFADAKLDQLEIDPHFFGGFSAPVVSLFRRRMQMIRNAPDERDFYQLKALHFEKLKGKRSHQFSMRLNDQWRLILEFKGKIPDKIVVVVEIADYH